MHYGRIIAHPEFGLLFQLQKDYNLLEKNDNYKNFVPIWHKGAFAWLTSLDLLMEW